jgi:hypothetical protein
LVLAASVVRLSWLRHAYQTSIPPTTTSEHHNSNAVTRGNDEVPATAVDVPLQATTVRANAEPASDVPSTTAAKRK